jgi:hypothetical protein
VAGTQAALARCFSLYRKWATVRKRSIQGPVFTQIFFFFVYSEYSPALMPCILATSCMCVYLCIHSACLHVLHTTCLEGSLRVLDLGFQLHWEQNSKIKGRNGKDFCLQKSGNS